MTGGDDAFLVKILGGCILLIYWVYAAYEIFANGKIAILAGEVTAIAHAVAFLLIVVGWVYESKERKEDLQNKIKEIRHDVDQNMKILDIIDAYLRQQKSK